MAKRWDPEVLRANRAVALSVTGRNGMALAHFNTVVTVKMRR